MFYFAGDFNFANLGIPIFKIMLTIFQSPANLQAIKDQENNSQA